MSDKNAAVLEYLVANSEIARSLEPPVTLEELLAHQTDQEHCIQLLTTLPKLEKDRFKPSNCLLDRTEPYDSLIGMSNDDLVLLRELCDYFMVSGELHEKLDNVIENGNDIEKYEFEFCSGEEWIRIGDIRGLNWAFNHGANHAFSGLLRISAKYGQLDCLKYLHERGVPFHKSICEAAASSSLECLKWLHENGCEWDEKTSAAAVKGSRLDCLHYALQNGCPANKTLCLIAVENGNLDCLRYLREAGYSWNEYMCETAAARGHLDCLKYVCDPPLGDRSPWNEFTAAAAAANGHLDCLRYALENGCPRNIKSLCCNSTITYGSDCLRYLHEAGYPWDEKVCILALENGNLECLKYAHQHGCPWPADFSKALKKAEECIKRYNNTVWIEVDRDTKKRRYLECIEYVKRSLEN